MPDYFQILGAAIRTAQQVGPATRVATAARDAIRDRNPDAIAYLVAQGWKDALDIAQPGLGDAASSLIWHANQAHRETLAAIEGNAANGYHVEVEGYPWDTAFRYLRGLRWGSFTILGPRGQGKTQLALRLAEKWRDKLGYEVETVGMYPEDRPSWATGVLPEDFVKRAVRLRAAINAVDTQGVERDPLDAMFDDGAPKKRATSLTVEQADQLLTAYSGRIVIFDEVGLNLGRGGMSALRNAMLDLFNQARHLGWLIIYCAQSSRQIPPDLLNGLGVFVKRPLGDEAGTDRDRGPTKEIWEAAVPAFELLRQHPN